MGSLLLEGRAAAQYLNPVFQHLKLDNKSRRSICAAKKSEESGGVWQGGGGGFRQQTCKRAS